MEGLITGGGIKGTMMGRLPWSVVQDVVVDVVMAGSMTPFLEAGIDWELLTPSGEPSLLSDDAGFFGTKFSGQDNRSKSRTGRTMNHTFLAGIMFQPCTLVLMRKNCKVISRVRRPLRTEMCWGVSPMSRLSESLNSTLS